MAEHTDRDALRSVLADSFDRIHQLIPSVLDGADEDLLTFRPGPDANSIGWLLWHAARVQDDHVADLAGIEQAWTAAGWHDRFGLPFDAADHGFGHTSDQVAAVRGITPEQLMGYHEAVNALTTDYLDRLDAAEVTRVVDEAWDPPVTAGVRLVSVVGDALQHLGQAAYVRGMYDTAR